MNQQQPDTEDSKTSPTKLSNEESPPKTTSLAAVSAVTSTTSIVTTSAAVNKTADQEGVDDGILSSNELPPSTRGSAMPPAGTSRGSQRNLSYSPPDARQSQTGLASYSPPERPMPISYSPPERMPQLISYSPDRRRKSYQSSVNYIEAAIHHSLSGDMNNPNKILSHPYEHIPVSSFFGCMYIYIDSQ